MRKKIWAIICLCLVTFSVTGCGTKLPDMTEEEQEIIAEYAASTLLSYDKGYNSKYKVDAMEEAKADAKKMIEANKNKVEATETPKATEEPTEAPTPTPTPVPTETPTPTPVPAETVQPTQKPQNDNRMAPYDIGKLFGIEGVEVNYVGFEALDSYPVIPENELAFTMQANQGTKLVVTKFELKNKTSETKTCNIVGQNIKFQMRFNDADFVAVQKTLLKDDFAALNCILQAGETKQVVVISQVTAGYETTISSIDLIARIGGENTMLKLQ